MENTYHNPSQQEIRHFNNTSFTSALYYYLTFKIVNIFLSYVVNMIILYSLEGRRNLIYLA